MAVGLKLRAPLACRLARVDKQRFNEAVARGEYPCAPKAIQGVSRTLTVAETIALYYDTRASLVARGVIRDGVPIAPYPQPFPAHPFPTFVPDPPGKAAG